MEILLNLTSFQFHKVRLKDCYRLTAPRVLCSFQFHKVRLKGDPDMIRVDEQMFQFHKVRLKENT